MTPTVQKHFGFDADPFSKRTTDDSLWLPPSKQGVVDALTETITERRWAMLVGDPGVGKTCVLRALRRRLTRDDIRLTYCCNTTLGRRDFYRQICHSLGLTPKATAAGVIYAITTHVAELGREQTQSVLLIDEAHLLKQDVLDHLHIIGNFEWDSEPLLTIVLIGLPHLEDRLVLRRNRSLYSRLDRRIRLSTLEAPDTADYLRNRLRQAGCSHEVFSADAIALLHEAAAGTLRDIDRLANAALRHTAAKDGRLVERASVSIAIRHDTNLVT